MAAVRKIVKSEGISEALIVFQGHRLVRVTSSARTQLFSRLMSMAAIALGMAGKIRPNQFRVELMAAFAPRHCRSLRHSGRVKVLPVRELLHTELVKLLWKHREFRERLERDHVAHLAELGIHRGILSRMTCDASCVARKPGRGAVVGPLMA